MVDLIDLVKRVQQLTQDENETQWKANEVARELVAEMGRLARQDLFGDVVWMQGVEGKSIYNLADQSLHVAAGESTETHPSDGIRRLIDTTAAFTDIPVVRGDRLRNLKDGSRGIISTLSDTEIICRAGFSGGTRNRFDAGDEYLVERPLHAGMVTCIRAVYYNGMPVNYTTLDTFYRQHAGDQDQTGIPRKWTTDAQELPTTLRVFPAPDLTGDATLLAPVAPHAMTWESNFAVWVYVKCHEFDTLDQPVLIPRAFHDPVVYRAAATLLAAETESQNLPVSQACLAVANLYLAALGVANG